MAVACVRCALAHTASMYIVGVPSPVACSSRDILCSSPLVCSSPFRPSRPPCLCFSLGVRLSLSPGRVPFVPFWVCALRCRHSPRHGECHHLSRSFCRPPRVRHALAVTLCRVHSNTRWGRRREHCHLSRPPSLTHRPPKNRGRRRLGRLGFPRFRHLAGGGNGSHRFLGAVSHPPLGRRDGVVREARQRIRTGDRGPAVGTSPVRSNAILPTRRRSRRSRRSHRQPCCV